MTHFIPSTRNHISTLPRAERASDNQNISQDKKLRHNRNKVVKEPPLREKNPRMRFRFSCLQGKDVEELTLIDFYLHKLS
jgi:hypothetical protein